MHYHLFGTFLWRGRVQPFASQFWRESHWPAVVDIDHAPGAVSGDDDEAIMLTGLMLEIWVLADRCAQYRRPISPADQVGLLLQPAFVDPFKPLLAWYGQIVRKKGPCATSSTLALIGAAQSLAQCGRHPQ